MYIELLHDTEGNINCCYCADTLPVQDGSEFFKAESIPEGYAQARVNIDTLTAMEIEAAAGQKIIIDPTSNEPTIVKVDRAAYISENFRVDTSNEITPPPGASIPAGMKVRWLVRK